MSRRVMCAVAAGAAWLLPAPPGRGAEIALSASAEFVESAATEPTNVKRTGEAALNWLGARLVHEIQAALKNGSPEAAVEICHLKSVSASGSAVPGMPAIKAFKITSDRVFNPVNAPDAAERLVLERVRRAIESGEAPRASIVQRIAYPDGGHEWRVYRALAVLPSCITCHGDAAAQTPALAAALRRRSPEVYATGYQPGEFRGLIRVTVAVSSPEPKP